jgi:N-acetylglucosamine-6-phosphate deacetylase
MGAVFALVGARIFDGERFLADHAVIVDGPRIAAVAPRTELAKDMAMRPVAGLLAPGFIDAQVNGGGGVLFNDQPTVAGIATIARAHRRFGTTGLLPTFITDQPERMAEAVGAVEAAIDGGVPGVLGIHLEGPYLNPERAGAHDPRWIRPWSDADLPSLTSLRSGVTLVTLAPEIVPPQAIARLRAAGVIVSIGHTAASAETIAAARRAGVTGFTHLFNAMRPRDGGAPGPAEAALADGQAWAGIIVDLEHVPAATLRAAIAARGHERTMLVTDAMPTVGTDLTEFRLQGRLVRRDGARLVTAGARLAGSSLDMATAVRNVERVLGQPLAAALRMASRAPAEFLGIGDDYGRIAPGYRASLVLLDETLRVTATWIDGAGGAA